MLIILPYLTRLMYLLGTFTHKSFYCPISSSFKIQKIVTTANLTLAWTSRFKFQLSKISRLYVIEGKDSVPNTNARIIHEVWNINLFLAEYKL